MFPVGVQICPTAEVMPKLETMAPKNSVIGMRVARVFIGKLLAGESLSLVTVFGVYFISFLAVHSCTAGNPERGYAKNWLRLLSGFHLLCLCCCAPHHPVLLW